MARLDYLVIGHIARDLTPDGPVAGGTATYAARAAAALGNRTAVLTSVGPDFAIHDTLSGVDKKVIPAAETTTFVNTYTSTGRAQQIRGQAAPLTAAALPPDWYQARVVHLGPIAAEVDPELVNAFPDSAIGLTPQGWLRAWDEHGRVYPCEWALAARVLPQADVVILSTEDLPDGATLGAYRRWSRLLILTKAAAGCTLFQGDSAIDVPGVTVLAVESTGAGDIFAAAFLTRWREARDDAIGAALFANQVAGYSVTQPTPAAKFAGMGQFLAHDISRS